MSEHDPGATSFEWLEWRNGWKSQAGEVISEALITLYVNGVELVTIMATPRQQDWLALGFLKNEGLIAGLDEVQNIHISKQGCCVDIWLDHAIARPERRIVTSGCGGGVTFDDPAEGIKPLESDLRVQPEQLFLFFRQLQPPNSLYARARGVHAAGLLDTRQEKLLLIVEDVGRHNTIDKLTGACLSLGIDPRDRIVLVTGRISSEMMRKVALMGCPVVASRTSPTSMSVQMARAWQVTLIGYVRQGGFRVYSNPERLDLTDSTD